MTGATHNAGLVAGLCFSKDRPLQLDGYLRSVTRWLSPAPAMTVLYCASTPDLAAGYADVVLAHPGVTFLPETDFGRQLQDWLSSTTTPLILFGCDDVVYIRPVDLRRVAQLMARPELLGFSLRLGKNICLSQSVPDPIPAPTWEQENDVMHWLWRSAAAEWAYAFELDGTVYRREVIQTLLNAFESLRSRVAGFDWRHPNALETAGNVIFKAADFPPRMASFNEACLVVPTVNRVQEMFANRLLGDGRTPTELEVLRRQGQELDLDEFARHTYARIHVGDFYLRSKTP